MKKLSSNTDLYQYLLSVSAELKQQGQEKFSSLIIHATQFAGQSTEFLGETRIALQQILKEENGTLSPQQRTDMQDILKQVDAALR